MRCLVSIFLLFLYPAFSIWAETKIQVEKWDIITYPLDAEAVEVEAIMNSLYYRCTIMPGDSLQISSISNISDRRSRIAVRKIDGASGNQEICHLGSTIHHIEGTHEIIKTKDGSLKAGNKIFFPIVFTSNVLEGAQTRKNLEIEDTSSSNVETVLLKEGDKIVYPSDAKPVQVEIFIDGLYFNCNVTPGDSFKVDNIVNYSSGEAKISFSKVGGSPEDPESCPLGSRIYINEIKRCKLIKTEEGIPEAINCRTSLANLFNG